jgi:HlyD family secretion protein
MSKPMMDGRGIFWGRSADRFKYIGSKAAGVMILGMFFLLSALVVATGPEAAPMERVEREWPVSYGVIEPAALSPSLQVYGKLETAQLASLRASVTADVAQVRLREGDWVNKGDIIVVLDEREASLRLQAARATVRRSEAALATVQSEWQLARTLGEHHQAQADMAGEKLKRFESLHQQRMIADAQLDEVRHEANERAMVHARHQATLSDFPNQLIQSQAALEEAQARLAQAELELSQTQVRSPFNGRIEQLDVAVGDRVTAGTALVQVADYDSLQVRASVPAKIAQSLRAGMQNGQPVVATTDIQGRKLGFELRGLAGSVKSGQSGIDSYFHVDADPTLTLGSVINLTLSLPVEHNVVALPLHALYDNTRVYRIADSRLQAVEIERVGEYMDKEGGYRILVRSPELARGDHIMMSQLPTAVTGLLVNPVTGTEQLAGNEPVEPTVALQ